MNGNSLDSNTLSLEGLKQYLLERIDERATYTESKDRATIWIKIGPDLASQLLRHMMYRMQRTLQSRRIGVLQSAILDGTLLNNNLVWMCVTGADDWIIINAQHTLQAIVQSGAEVELQMVIDRVGNLTDVARRYGMFDIGGLRSQKEIVAAADMNANGILTHGEDYYLVATTKAATAINIMRGAFVTNVPNERASSLLALQRDWLTEYEKINECLRPLVNEISIKDDATAPLLNSHMKEIRNAFKITNVVAVFMLGLKSHPSETEMLLNALVERSRTGVAYETSSVESLFLYLLSFKSKDLLDNKRRPMFVGNIIRMMVAYREVEEIEITELYDDPTKVSADDRNTMWEALTDGRVPRFESHAIKVDRKKIVRGVFGKMAKVS